MTASSAPRPRHPPMSATATLSTCYVPLPAASPDRGDSTTSGGDFDPLARPSDDDDGNALGLAGGGGAAAAAPERPPRTRGPRTLRRIRLDKSISSQSSGSSLVEWGHTKLAVSVRGPRPASRASLPSAAGGGLACEVRYLPHVGTRAETLARHALSQDFAPSRSAVPGGGGGGGGGGGARVPRDALGTAQDASPFSSGGCPCSPAAFPDEAYLSGRLREALSPAVDAGGLGSKMCVEVFALVLQSDGGVLGAAIVGASLALADAGVGMRDVVCSGSAAVMKLEDENEGGKASYRAVADPTEDEILRASGVVTIAAMPNWGEVTVWDQFGKMSMEASAEAMELARDGCATMHKFLKNCLLGDRGEGDRDGTLEVR
ncbi:hypothetical protein ACHAWF_002582 [Thalassiosira exigua]